MTEITDLARAHSLFINFLRSKNRSPATILAYGKDVDQLADYLKNAGKTAIGEACFEDLTGFISTLKRQNYTPKSISRKINSLKTFFRFLLQNRLIEDDFSTELTHPRSEMKNPRILSKLEYRALRDAARDDPRLSAIIEIFLQTGLRISEMFNLKLTDVRDNELCVASQQKHPGRVVPLNKAAKAAIARYLAVRHRFEEPSLFITKTGKPLLIRNIRNAIDRCFKTAGIAGAKVNDLRHTFIAHHLMSGTPVNYISKIVGHKRLSTTEKYLELVKDKIQPDVKLEEL